MSERDHEALGDILKVLDRALGFPIPDLQILEETDYLQDALIRCLEVPWRAIAGMRDLLIHAYDRVDLEEVWEAYRQFHMLRQQIAEMVGHNKA
jgi:uncharacterized protein with HEPN domain